MPITDNRYVSPGWVDGDSPAIDADELNAISETLQMQGAIGTVESDADAVAKTVTISDVANKIVGMTIGVTFPNGNTALTPTLNLNGFGAASIYYSGAPIDPDMIRAGDFYIMQYDGTYWQLINPNIISIVETFGHLKTEVITSTKTWYCPNGVKKVFVRLFGGGGAALSQNSSAGGGGGSGYMATGVLNVTPGEGYIVTIGEAGTTNIDDANGAGGTTSFGTLLSANGGQQAIRSGYDASTSTICWKGGNGGAGGGGGFYAKTPQAAQSAGGADGGDGQYGGGGGAGLAGKGGAGGTYGGGGGSSYYTYNGQEYNTPGGAGGENGGAGGNGITEAENGINTITENLPFVGEGTAGTKRAFSPGGNNGIGYGGFGGGGGGYGGNGGNGTLAGAGGGGGYGAAGSDGSGNENSTGGVSPWFYGYSGGGGGYGGAANGAGGGGYGAENYGCGAGAWAAGKSGVCILTYVDPITNNISQE